MKQFSGNLFLLNKTRNNSRDDNDDNGDDDLLGENEQEEECDADHEDLMHQIIEGDEEMPIGEGEIKVMTIDRGGLKEILMTYCSDIKRLVLFRIAFYRFPKTIASSQEYSMRNENIFCERKKNFKN